MKNAEANPPKKDAKRVILQAAYTIVRDEGVDKLSAGKVAQVAGMSKSGFFHHFQQVEDLYLYILDDLLLTMRQSVLARRPATISSLIDYVAEASITAHGTNPEILSMLLYFFSLSQQNQTYAIRLRAHAKTIFSDWEAQLSDHLAGKLSSEDLNELVLLMDIFFLGLAVRRHILEDLDQYKKSAHNFGEMLEDFYTKKLNSHNQN